MIYTMRLNIITIVLVLISGCTNTDYIIAEPQNPIIGNPPSTFEISVNQITDEQAYISWDNATSGENTLITYEVVINDSVVAYDLVQNSYFIKKLRPDTKYSVSINALDSLRNSSVVSAEFQTMKSFVQNVISFNFDFEHYILFKAISTKDGGVLISGHVTVSLSSEPNESFIVKLDQNYTKQWVHIFQSYEEIESDDLINDLLQTDDGSYLVVRTRTITKISENGDELWTYENSDKTDCSELVSVTQDNNGDYYFTGRSCRNHGSDISDEYILGKLSNGGKEEWFKIGGTTLFNRPKKILIEANGNLLIFGTAESQGASFDDLSNFTQSFWLLRTNNKGDFVDQNLFVNTYSVSDNPSSIFITEDNNYLLVGTASGYMPPYGYSDTKQRFLKVSPNGDELWDKYHYLNSNTGKFPRINGLVNLNNNSKLVLTGDDRGIAISTINSLGELEKHIKLSGYPDCIFIKSTENENFHCITKDGRIIMFNHDGYLE